MATKKKTTVDALAKQKARYQKHLERESAKPASRSGIKGRSLPSKASETEKVEEVQAAEVETAESGE